MNLTFRKADAADLELLVKNRIEVLRAANGLSGDTDMSLVEQESRDYYRHAFEHGGHVALLVYDGDSFAGCGGVSFYRVMPTYHNPTGRCAYIMNMYTRPRIPTQGDCFAYAGVSYERDPVAWNHESHIGSHGRGASSV